MLESTDRLVTSLTDCLCVFSMQLAVEEFVLLNVLRLLAELTRNKLNTFSKQMY